jgi:predicted ATPase/class 3 adenylate cyclase
MRQLPTGTVTFLFSDIEGSTKLLDELGAEAYAEALAEHRRVMREAFAATGGVEVDTQGDAFFVAFPSAWEALAGAAQAQAALAAGPVRVRIGIHSGEPLLTEEGYVGIDVHRGARVMSAGHGGQVLVSHATYALLDGESGLVDLGRHRLKDLTEPQPLYQLGEGEFPSLRTLDQTNLPVQPTPLVGREAELSELLGLLGEARLVTLTGAGGSGKTRLALQAAAELVEEYGDGVWWVSLAALRDPELVEPTIAQVVGAKDGLAGHLRSKKTMLLLDNLEQLLEAAPQIAALVAEAPELRVLATSRERLAIGAEQEYPVPTLVPAEAVALFTARARRLRPRFEPDEHVEEICRRLDGLPLALELAAARVKVLTPAQIAERLDRSLELLTAGSRDTPERQRTLRATIEWSYDLLDEKEKELFASLAVFAGSFELEAAENVCKADLDTLASLVDKSLLRQTEEGRFFMLETIREFAGECLEAGGQLDRIRRSHFDFFLALAEEARDDLEFDQRATVWLKRLELEHDNLRAALQWALDLDEARLELRLAAALSRFWHARSNLDEGRSRVAGALARDPEAPAEVRGHALRWAAMMAHKQGDLNGARALAEEAAAGYRAAGHVRGLANAINMLGVVAAGERKHEEARALYEESKSMREDLGDEFELLSSFHNLGLLALDQGDHDEARKQLEAALALGRKNNQEGAVANSLCDLGFVALGQSLHDEAQALFEESVRMCVELGWKENVDYGLVGLACVSAAGNRLEHAAKLVGAADALGEEIHFRLEPYAESMRVRTTRELDSRLGHDRFATCLAEGRSLSFSEAVSLALADVD